MGKTNKADYKNNYSFSLSMELMGDINKMWREENVKRLKKNEKPFSKSEFVEKLLKLGIRARKEGYFFID